MIPLLNSACPIKVEKQHEFEGEDKDEAKGKSEDEVSLTRLFLYPLSYIHQYFRRSNLHAIIFTCEVCELVTSHFDRGRG